MEKENSHHWVSQGKTRAAILRALAQPMTVTQIAQRIQARRETCSSTLTHMTARGLVHCLNETARRSRVYWLTNKGQACQASFNKEQTHAHVLPDIDWILYGWICFSHRAAVIKALDQPLQPSAIARRARRQNPDLRMSANNVRDVIRAFTEHGVVEPVIVRRGAHPRYQLTETGRALRELLLQAETPRPTP